jgi:hypothetical protein
VYALEIRLITSVALIGNIFSLLFVVTRYFRLCMMLSLTVITLRISDFHLRYRNMEHNVQICASSKQAPATHACAEVDHITTAQTQNFVHNSHKIYKQKEEFTSPTLRYDFGMEFRSRIWFPVLVILGPEGIP